MKVSNALIPLLRSNARLNFIYCILFFSIVYQNLIIIHLRVVNVSSRSGLLGQLTSEELKNKYKDENATINDINNLINQYIE